MWAHSAADVSPPADTHHTPIAMPTPAEPPGTRISAHLARQQLARLLERAHGGECFLLLKYGKPWARLLPLASEGPPPLPQRQPGRLRHLGALSAPRALLRRR
jgi:antitoxin (DNA-binding transcriptional repressor) of toxin-antitoxin stability system